MAKIENNSEQEFDSPKKINRYVAVIDLYIYASNDEQAISQANGYIENLQKEDDNQAKIIEFVEQPFGTFTNRKINFK